MRAGTTPLTGSGSGGVGDEHCRERWHNMRIQLTELRLVDGADRKLVVNATLIYGLVPLAVGTLVKMRGGEVHVLETTHVIEQLIQQARQHGFAKLADLPSGPEEKFFATGSLPGPVYALNRIQSRAEDLTLNGVDLQYLIEQHDRMVDRIRAEALGE